MFRGACLEFELREILRAVKAQGVFFFFQPRPQAILKSHTSNCTCQSLSRLVRILCLRDSMGNLTSEHIYFLSGHSLGLCSNKPLHIHA